MKFKISAVTGRGGNTGFRRSPALRLFPALLLMALTLTGCIDEDLSDCGADHRIEYTTFLHTDLTSQLSEELHYPAERGVAAELLTQLSPVFSPVMSRLSTSFFDMDADPASAPFLSEEHPVNAPQTALTIYLSKGNLRHLAVANHDAVPSVDLTLPSVSGVSLQTLESDASHVAPLFSGRLDLERESAQSTDHHVTLYQVNCASVLVIDASELTETIEDVTGNAGGFAESFAVSDSLFVMPATRASARITSHVVSDAAAACYALWQAHMPSADNGDWTMEIYVRINGSVTQTILTIPQPVRAGRLRIVRAKLKSNGSVEPADPTVGASVNLDWHSGTTGDIII